MFRKIIYILNILKIHMFFFDKIFEISEVKYIYEYIELN